MPNKNVNKSMSGGGRDHFPTPQWAADFALQRVAEIHPYWGERTLTVLEPGCGDLAPFLIAAEAVNAESKGDNIRAHGVDISTPPEQYPTAKSSLVYGVDFLQEDASWFPKRDMPDKHGFDIIATNPPYSFAEEFVRRSLELLHPWGIAVFLMRIGFAGSIKRMPLFRDRPPYEIGEFVRRFTFDGKGTDYTDYCLFFWQGEKLYRSHLRYNAGTRFYWIDNSSKDKERIEPFGLGRELE